MNKRAVSPLIATFLLLVFSLALGSVVMSWGKDYVEKATGDSEITVKQVSENSVFEELDRRYARGEITKEQYEEMKRILMEK